MMAPQPPADYVRAPARVRALKAALLDQNGGAGRDHLRAEGCRRLRQDHARPRLCDDDAIQDAYHDGILWVTLGESPGEPQGRIEDLIQSSGASARASPRAMPRSTRLAEILADRRCLLVIDDVWQRGDAAPFLQGGPHCARLLTTRNADTLPPDARQIRVDAMQASEAVELLQVGLPPIEHDRAARLAARLGEWPLLLKLVNGALRERVDRRRSRLPTPWHTRTRRSTSMASPPSTRAIRGRARMRSPRPSA